MDKNLGYCSISRNPISDPPSHPGSYHGHHCKPLLQTSSSSAALTPTELSAALTLYRAMHTCRIFDSNKPRNRYGAATRLTPTWEYQDPDACYNAAREEPRDCLIRGCRETAHREDAQRPIQSDRRCGCRMAGKTGPPVHGFR